MDFSLLFVNTMWSWAIPIVILVCLYFGYKLGLRAFELLQSEQGLDWFGKLIVAIPLALMLFIASSGTFYLLTNPIFDNAASEYGCFKVNEDKTTLITHNLDDIRLREWITDTEKNLSEFSDLSSGRVKPEWNRLISAVHDYEITMNELLNFFLWIKFDEEEVRSYLKSKVVESENMSEQENISAEKVKEWLRY